MSQLRVFKYQQISRDMETIRECMHSQTYPGVGSVVFWEDGLWSQGPGFILKVDIGKFFLLWCVFSEIREVSGIQEKNQFSFYQVIDSSFLSLKMNSK